MTIISIVNQKGGVGKTSTTINIATALAIAEQKVLIIDLDPQGNSSSGLGINQSDRNVTIYHVLMNLKSITESIIQTTIPKLDIITSNTNLCGAEIELISVMNREYILSKRLSELIKNYDYILIDCPPSLNLLTINALVASKEVLIPMQCDFYSLEGLSHLLKTIEKVEKKLNPEIKICGILFTMYDKRNRLTEQVEKDVRNHLGNLVFNTTIPRNIRISEAPSFGKPAIVYDHKCSGSMAYIELSKEILNRRQI
jgi:chromosome partitioning protein